MRNYSSEYPVDIQMIKDRVLLVLRLYDKINPDKVTFFPLFYNTPILPCFEMQLRVESEA